MKERLIEHKERMYACCNCCDVYDGISPAINQETGYIVKLPGSGIEGKICIGIIMIKSMTGFGRGEFSKNNKKFIVEMKSVNHRYLDVNIKLPKKFSFYEAFLRNLLKNYTTRGKIDIFITYEDLSEKKTELTYNGELARQYYEYIEQMGRDLKIVNDVTTTSLIKCPEIFTMQEQDFDEEEIEQILKTAFETAAGHFADTKISEGENLKTDLCDKLDEMMKYVEFIEMRSPQIITEYKEKIYERVKELLDTASVDDNRLMMEVTIFADKVCVDEEIVRLKSHIAGMKETLKQGGTVGRKLDFVAQEMNREANTILSKSSDLQITDVGIELKTLIEKVREQIQNIE